MNLTQWLPYKPFSETAHDANDSYARLAFSGWLTHKGHRVESSGTYDVDLAVTRPNGSSYPFEVERRSTRLWNGPFPFNTLEFGLRKREFLSDYPNAVFGVLNHNGTRFIAVSGAILLAHGQIVSKTLNNGQTDHFMSIGTGWCIQGCIS